MAPLVHIALAQFKPRKGDYRANLERLGAVFAQADKLQPRPMVLCLAESALTGYFLEGGVRDNAVTAGTFVTDLDEVYRSSVSAPKTLDVTAGFYEIWNNKLYNSSIYVTLGDGEPLFESFVAILGVLHVGEAVEGVVLKSFADEMIGGQGADGAVVDNRAGYGGA